MVKIIELVEILNQFKFKEIWKMNFQTIFKELNELYEEMPAAAGIKVKEDSIEAETEVATEAFIEDIDAEEIGSADDEIEIIDDEAADEAPEEVTRQLALECSNCSAIIIKPETDVIFDEKTDLTNVEETCQFCEETKGYMVIGVVTPYEVTESEADAEVAFEETNSAE
jgi:hypothetical protein